MWNSLMSATGGNPNRPAAVAADPTNNDHEKQQQQEQELETQPSEDLDMLLDLNAAPTIGSHYTTGSGSDIAHAEDFVAMTESEDTTVGMANQTSQSFNDDIIDDDYVPPGLVDFVQQANKTLQQQQTEFMLASSVSLEREAELESPAGSPQHQMQEDEQLKAQALGRLGVTTSNSSAKISSSSSQDSSDLLGRLGVSIDHVAAAGPKTSTKKSRPVEDNFLMSPDLLLTPQPNPTFGITDSEAKQRALEGITPFVPASSKGSFASRLEEEQQPEPPTHVQQKQLDSTPETPVPEQWELMQLISETTQESPCRDNSSLMSPNSTFDLTPGSMQPATPRSVQPANTTPSSVPSVGSSEFAVTSDESIQESLERMEASTPTSTSTSMQLATPSSVPSVSSSNIADAPASSLRGGSALNIPSSRASAAATPSPRASVAKTPSSQGSAAATSSSRAAASGGKPSPQVSRASPTPTPSFVDRLSRSTTASATKAVRPPPVKTSISPLPSGAASVSSSTRGSGSRNTAPNATASADRLSRSEVPTTVSGSKSSPQAPSFVDRLSRSTVASAVKAVKSPPVKTSISLPPSGAASATRGSGPRNTTPNATASSDRLSRTVNASGSSEVPTPEPGSESSPQAPSFVNRLSRPTVASAVKVVKSPPRTRASPVTKIPAVSARAVRPATTSKPVVSTRPLAASSSNRLLKGTAASRARSTGPTDKSAALAEDRQKARERVRQRMLQQQKEQQKNAPVKGTTSQSTQSGKASVNDGIALARERVRQRQLQQKAISEKENRVRKSSTSVRSSYGRASMGTTRPRVTVPQGPKFATDAKYGEKHLSRRDSPTLAQSGDIMRKGLRGDDKAPYTRSGRPSLTIPQAPKFATSKRHAETPSAKGEDRSLAGSSDYYAKHLRDDLTVGSASSIGSHGHVLTIPRGPNFATTAKFGEKPQTPRATAADRSLAQSSDLFGKALRDGKSPAPALKREGPTIPQSPKFQARGRRVLPLSAEEKEAEMMEYNASHPFRANPVLTHAAGSQRPPPSRRRMTGPVPSHSTSRRHEESDLQEMQNQFHARPMPTFSSQSAKRQTVRATVTTPVPFNLSSDRRVQTDPRAVTSPDDAELTKKFHARPVPQSTYEGILKAEKKSLPPPAKPFTLQSSLRHEAYQKQLAEKLAQEEAERQAQMTFHARSFKSPPTPERIRADRGPTEPCPFPLSSDVRRAAFEQEKNEKLAAQEEERKRQAAFKAKPAPKSTYEPKALSPKQAEMAARHAATERERSARLAAEEDAYRDQSNFKAKPVPKSTYVYEAVLPKASELVDPFSPLLQSKKRAEDRKSFDAKAYRQRMLDAGRKREQQERIAAEEKADLEERRRLPVSEGGMIPTAAPVNAIFFAQD